MLAYRQDRAGAYGATQLPPLLFTELPTSEKGLDGHQTEEAGSHPSPKIHRRTVQPWRRKWRGRKPTPDFPGWRHARPRRVYQGYLHFGRRYPHAGDRDGVGDVHAFYPRSPPRKWCRDGGAPRDRSL